MKPSKSPPRSVRPFAHLEPRVKHVSEAAVRKKWKPIPQSSQEKIKRLLTNAQNRTASGARKGQPRVASESCVQELVERLMTRLPRMPFPPSTEEQQFDFEATLHRIRTLEDDMTSNTHSANLLKAQIAKEERLLAEDRREVEQLERGLRSSETIRRQQGRALHPIIKGLGTTARADRHRPMEISTTRNCNIDLDLVEGDLDPQLNALTQQLWNHLRSMRRNIAGLDSIATVIDRTSRDINTLRYHAAPVEQ